MLSMDVTFFVQFTMCLYTLIQNKIHKQGISLPRVGAVNVRELFHTSPLMLVFHKGHGLQASAGYMKKQLSHIGACGIFIVFMHPYLCYSVGPPWLMFSQAMSGWHRCDLEILGIDTCNRLYYFSLLYGVLVCDCTTCAQSLHSAISKNGT